MSFGETHITVIGRLTADPELRTTGNGGRVVNLTIASTARTFNRQSNSWEDGDSLFLRCSCWDSQRSTLASNVAESLSKGMKVIAQGTLSTRKWTDKQGENRESVELKLTDIGPCLSDNQVRAQKIARQPQAGYQNQGGFQPGYQNQPPTQNQGYRQDGFAQPQGWADDGFSAASEF